MTESIAIAARKTEHIEVCLNDQVESEGRTQFGGYRLSYRALPEIALADVDLRTAIAGKTLSAPLIIGAMTGGTQRAMDLNRILAEAAERRQIGFALGSGRIVLERPETAPTFQVRSIAPTTLIFANLGAVQFNYGVDGKAAQHLVDVLGADVLNLHLNPLQEAIQEGGDTDFSRLSEKIRTALTQMTSPVFVKEVGSGIDAHTAQLLAGMPIAGLETAGVGGTSWARVEALRATEARTRTVGLALGAFGVPTADSVIACRAALSDGRTVIASGGIRTAEDMAVALALGADAVACALPFLMAADKGLDAVLDFIDDTVHALRILCFVCGARTPTELRGRLVKADS